MHIKKNNFEFYIYGKEQKENGFRIKINKNNICTHYNFIFLTRNNNREDHRHRTKQLSNRKAKFILRPSLTIFEYSRWQTENMHYGSKRIKVAKQYLRLKWCPGGKEI